ncbi:hypothetical protein HCN44_003749 [Aphidius gifuensis]|uniref:Uncharacterized protein n=1 Tax=Aphidius gifuensis TaxID=684658 RepID=A0A834XNB9_APHGI|nr:hypothetical protein HCN44_003749 [Aphidius gifuensis]
MTTASYYTIPSLLEQKSLIQAAINIWNDPSIKSKIKDQNLLTSNLLQRSELSAPIILQKLKIHAFRIIENLELPMTKIDELIYVIEPIGKEMIDYLSEIHDRLVDPGDKYPSLNDYVDSIQWTVDGQIDHTKTLMTVLKNVIDKNLPDEKIDYTFMFIEACKYSHADGINEIWHKLSAKDKQNIKFAISNTRSENIAVDYNPRDIVIVTQGILQTHNRALLSGNTESLKYFLLKANLEGDDKDNYIINTLLHNGVGAYNRMTINNYVFLMQQLSNDARLNYLKEHREYSLFNLINSWPWRYIYFDVFEASLINRNPAPTRINYENLLLEIIEKIDDEYSKFRNVKQTSTWMIGKFWSDYKDHFDEGLIETCWSLNTNKFVKIQVSIIIIRNWNIKRANEKLIEECSQMGFMLRTLEYYDLLYDIGEYILKTQQQRYNFMRHVTLQNICTYFIIIGDRYDEIDRLIEWKYRDNDRESFKNSINWISIIRGIQENKKLYNSIYDKLHLLADWLNFKDKQRSEFKKCIDKFFNDDSNLAEWNNFYNCIEKSGLNSSKKLQCTPKTGTSTSTA